MLKRKKMSFLSILPPWLSNELLIYIYIYTHIYTYIYIYIFIIIYYYILFILLIYLWFMSILLLWDFSALCVMDHLWPLTLRYYLSLLSTLLFISTSNAWPCIKCMSCHKTTVVITGRAHCFLDYMYIMPIVLL